MPLRRTTANCRGLQLEQVHEAERSSLASASKFAHSVTECDRMGRSLYGLFLRACRLEIRATDKTLSTFLKLDRMWGQRSVGANGCGELNVLMFRCRRSRITSPS